MSYKLFYGLLGAAGLGLLVTTAYPSANSALTSSVLTNSVRSHTTAQAQLSNLSDGMTLARLESVLNEEADEVQGSNGQWQVRMGDRALIVLADTNRNRMRIVSPAATVTELDAVSIQSMLLANFHTALDARYAISDDTVVSVFVHPLASLNENDLRSALSQVTTLAETFGTTYSSGDLGFGPGSTEPQGASEAGLGI